MSDTTALSYEYTNNATFAEKLNEWLLTLKKGFLEIPEGAARPDPEALREACGQLSCVLAALIARLDTSQPTAPETGLTFPEEFFQRLEAKRGGQGNWFLQDLKDAKATLDAGKEPEGAAWEILEEIGDAADATASASFRRLWRR
jgi:hypothetical protein